MPLLKVLICIPEDLKNTISEVAFDCYQALSDLLVLHPQHTQGSSDIRGFFVI